MHAPLRKKYYKTKSLYFMLFLFISRQKKLSSQRVCCKWSKFISSSPGSIKYWRINILQIVLDTGEYIFSRQNQILEDIYSLGSTRYWRIYLLQIVLDTGEQVVLITGGYIYSRQDQILDDIYILQIILDTGSRIYILQIVQILKDIYSLGSIRYFSPGSFRY